MRAQLNQNEPDPFEPISIIEISLVVDSIKGFGYPFAGPIPCNP
jgi:hypothetical protein